MTTRAASGIPPDVRKLIEQALADLASGRVELIPHEEVKRRLAARRVGRPARPAPDD